MNTPPVPPPSPFGSAPDPTPAPLPNSNQVEPWYAKTWATIVALVVFPLQPVGIFLMWKYCPWERGPKVVATIVSLVFFSSLLPKSPDESKTRTASTATQTATAPDASSVLASNSNSANNSQPPAKSPKKAAPVAKKVAPKPVASAPQSNDVAPAFEDTEAAPQKPKSDLPENVEVLDIPGVGKREVGIVDDVAYAVLKVETTSAINNALGMTQADGQFYVLTVRAFNNAKKTHDVTTLLMKLLDDEGREFDSSNEGTTALRVSGDDRVQSFSAQLQPGIVKEFVLVYDAPTDATGLRLKIPGGFLSTSGDAIIRLPKQSE